MSENEAKSAPIESTPNDTSMHALLAQVKRDKELALLTKQKFDAIPISEEDVLLIIQETRLSKAHAEDLLRAHSGDSLAALKSFINE